MLGLILGAVAVAVTVLALTKRDGAGGELPPYLGEDDDGIYFKWSAPESAAVSDVVTTYGVIAEGKGDDGTIWIEGKLGTGEKSGDSPEARNIYARASQHTGSGDMWWTLARRKDIESIAAGNPPTTMRFFVASLARIREAGAVKPGSELIVYG